MLYIFLEFNVVRIFDNFSQTYDIKTQSDIFWTEEVSFNLLSNQSHSHSPRATNIQTEPNIEDDKLVTKTGLSGSFI